MIRTLDREGCVLSYELRPGNPDLAPVVLLHGYGVDRTMWDRELDALAGRTALALDIRGHGNSRPCGSFSVPLAAEDLRAVLEREGLERSVLVGLSMGGFVVQEYAFRYGGAAGYWVIGDTPILLDGYARWETWSLARSTAMFRPFPWGFLKAWMVRASACTPQGREKLRPMFDQLTKEEFLQGWAGVAACLHPEPGFQFDAPLLVCCGEKDRTGTIRQHMGDWARAYPGAVVRVVPGAAHCVNLDQPEVFRRMLEEFLADLS